MTRFPSSRVRSSRVPRSLQLSVALVAIGSVAYGGAAGAAPQPTPVRARVITTHVAPLGTVGGVSISGEGFGSAIARVPGHPHQVYGLTDRGPNVDGPDDTKIEPLPDFAPAIGRFRITGSRARLLATIPLRAHDGTPYNGRVNTQADTGETITDLDGTVLATSPEGYDPEGLVAMRDGTFWVSDEYGPFITHVDRHGRQIGRLSPYDGSLPVELRNRGVNRGMEGLTVTPDGTTLVGIMQSALDQPDLTSKFKSVSMVRIVTVSLRTGRTHEYAYLLHDPQATGTAVSEITAVSRTRFLVLERDGSFAPGADKKVYAVSLHGATDIGPAAHVNGLTYDGPAGGLLHDGATLEQTVGDAPTADATATLTGLGIRPVTSRVAVDLGALVDSVDPTGGFFGHDKLEGLALFDHGRRLLVSNDDDFGIAGVTGDTPPFTLTEKVLPDGRQDDGELLLVDLGHRVR